MSRPLNVKVSIDPPGAASAFSAWARKLDELYADERLPPSGVRLTAVTRVVGTSTWRLRADARITTFATLTVDGATWDVVGVRLPERGGRYVEVDATRYLTG